jgi:acyl-CoA thioesterase-1
MYLFLFFYCFLVVLMQLRWVIVLFFLALLVWGYFFSRWTSRDAIIEEVTETIDQVDVWPEEITRAVGTERRIYALGDSLTAWYRLPLDDSYPSQLETLLQLSWFNYTVVNGWKSWDTSAGLLARLDWIVADARSGDLALLVIGANDWLQSLSVSALEKNVSLTIEFLLSKDIRVVLGWMQLPTNLDPLYREWFTSLYPRLADQYDLPLIPFFLDNVATIPSLNLPDWIHPTADWYTIIADQVLAFLSDNDLIVQE